MRIFEDYPAYADEMEQVHAAVFQQPTSLHTVLGGTPSGLVVTAAQPQGKGKVIPNCMNDFPIEADVDTVGNTLKGRNHIVGGYGGLTGMDLALNVDIAVFCDNQANFIELFLLLI